MSLVEKLTLDAKDGERESSRPLGSQEVKASEKSSVLAPVADRPVYHQSEIQSFLKCGKIWEFRYVRGIKLRPRGAMTLGSAVDLAVSLNLSQKIHSGEDLSASDTVDAFSMGFDSRSDETDWQDEDPGELKDVGVRLVQAHHQKLAPAIDPESVQEKFLIRIDADYDLGGTIDFTEKSGVIGDTKTSRLAYGEQAAHRSVQASMYDFAYEALRGRKSSGFRFDVLIKPGSSSAGGTKQVPRVQQVHAQLGQDDRSWLFETVSNVHKAIQAGVTLPASEGSWYCSPKWCGYWAICKGRKSK